ncbi:DNA repair protein RadC, partial [Gluconobacter japonicus]
MTNAPASDDGFAEYSGKILFQTAPFSINPQPTNNEHIPPPVALLSGRGRRLDDDTLLLLIVQIFTGRKEKVDTLVPALLERFGSVAALLSASNRELA